MSQFHKQLRSRVCTFFLHFLSCWALWSDHGPYIRGFEFESKAVCAWHAYQNVLPGTSIWENRRSVGAYVVVVGSGEVMTCILPVFLSLPIGWIYNSCRRVVNCCVVERGYTAVHSSIARCC